MTGRLTRITHAVSLAAIGSLALVSSAIADFHLTKIRQINGEGGASADSSYIELQMYVRTWSAGTTSRFGTRMDCCSAPRSR
jgi:hypothetical protein